MKFTINPEKCTSCGICAEECPAEAISRKDESSLYTIYQPFCIRCSHCGIICPADAVICDAGDFSPWEPPEINQQDLLSFLQGKRSIRHYSEKPVSRDVLETLLFTGSVTSTASNRQEWEAVVVTGEKVRELSRDVMTFYQGIYKMARNPLFRFILAFTEAKRYVRNPGTFRKFRRFIERFEEGGDPVFFNAPAAVVLHAHKRHKQWGLTDCVLAGAAMMYGAQSFGLGSCMIGFAQVVLNFKSGLREKYGIGKKNTVHSVFTLGYSSRPYRKLPKRKPIPAQFIE